MAPIKVNLTTITSIVLTTANKRPCVPWPNKTSWHNICELSPNEWEK